MKTKTRK